MFKNEQLLQNEEEFLRMNSEIDLTTKDLMEQVNQVMVSLRGQKFRGYAPCPFVQLDIRGRENITSVIFYCKRFRLTAICFPGLCCRKNYIRGKNFPFFKCNIFMLYTTPIFYFSNIKLWNKYHRYWTF